MARRGIVLYDAHDRPFNATRAISSWHGSSHSRRTRHWAPSSASINTLIASDVPTLIARARDVNRKDPLVQNSIDILVSELVGTGIVPQPQGLEDEVRAELIELWTDWIEECDAGGTQNFYGLQVTAARAALEGGDCFIRLRPRRQSDGLVVPLQLQLLEAEQLDHTFNEDRGAIKIKAGIEFGPLGRPIAYHMWREHPGEMVGFRQGDRVRVPASEILHVFQPTRPGQIRGVPRTAVVLAKIQELLKYDDAEVMRKQMAAMLVAFETISDGAENIFGEGGVEGVDDDDVELASLEPGTVQQASPGHDIKFNNPMSDQGYEEFWRIQARLIAAGMGVMYEQATGDLRGVTFSSIRFGLIGQRRRIKQWQNNMLVHQMCRPVWRRVIETAVLSGALPLPAGGQAVDSRRVLRRLLRPRWRPTPGFEYVDPEKEVKAIVKAIRAGLTSRGAAVAHYGFDVEELDREIAADNARADELGLVFDSDARGDQDATARAAALTDGAREREDRDDGEDDDVEAA